MQQRRDNVKILGTITVSVAAGGALVVGGQPVSAADFLVTNTDDAGPGSLRQAVLDANASAGADVIRFDAGVTGGAITLTGGQIVIADDLEIVGPGAEALTISGNSANRMFYVYSAGDDVTVTISGLTMRDGAADRGGAIRNFEDLTLDSVVLTGNTASDRGGALFSDTFTGGFTIVDSVLSGNTATQDGGAIYNEDTGREIEITRTTFTGNTAGDNGGAIAFYDPDNSLIITDSTISGNTAGGNGGGIYIYNFDSGRLEIRETTISDNTATGNGGGVFLYDANAIIVQSTISGNTATNGGGLVAYSVDGLVAIEHSTITGNVASGTGGGLYAESGTLYIDHSIIAGNSAPSEPDVDADSVAVDSLFSTSPASMVDGGNNQFGTDPLLGPLQDNGGLTETHLPAAGSPAIDAGDPGYALSLTADQRDLARIVGVIDIGAVEVDAGTVSIDPDSITIAEDGGTVTVSVTRTGTGDGTASVDVITSDGTATQGADYTQTAATVSWSSGEIGVKTVDVPILTDDDGSEGDETFTIALANAVGSPIDDATPSVTVTITDVAPASTTTTTTTTIAATPPSTTVPTPSVPVTLPPTGGSEGTGVMAALAAAFLALGVGTRRLVRRR